MASSVDFMGEEKGFGAELAATVVHELGAAFSVGEEDRRCLLVEDDPAGLALYDGSRYDRPYDWHATSNSQSGGSG